ncbi:MAG: Hsp20/alpha crystallin family protein [Fusicatenibacter sp.]|nr:Hsp20/alpha crystallin family protein [Lachnospiraceae bacterium]MDY2938359.1 Hsp20/alpha crystallin family protein [Fusicatenibacter sp.]
MMMPSIFGENLFDEFMNDFSFPNVGKALYGKREPEIMKTDVREKDNVYEVDVDLPGFKKEDIQMELEKGYLTIRAAKGLDKDTKDKDGKYIRRERYSGNVSRSFYVGEKVQKEDIHPKFENGILSFTLPKEKKAVEEKSNYIAIEG